MKIRKPPSGMSAYCFLILIGLLHSGLMMAQVPDDINGRLWRLAKVWGFAKYFHPGNCEADWNSLLLNAIDSVLESTTNEAFNHTMAGMLAAAGPVPFRADPLVNDADINLNADFDWMDDHFLRQDVRDILDSIVINFRPKDNCLVKFNDGTDPNFLGLLNFRNDNILNIPAFSYAVESHRLLTLFYYWNLIEYFHPDRYLMDQDWDTTLFQFIPLIRAVNNETEFHIRFINLVTYLNDTHGFTYSSIINFFFGSNYPNLKINYIEGQTVVTKVGQDIPDVQVGDIIKKINGFDVNYLRDSLGQFSPASNNGARQRDLDRSLLLSGPFNSTIQLEMKDSLDQLYTSSVKRKTAFIPYNDWISVDPYPTWEVTECGYGYVNMGKLQPNEVTVMYAALKHTPAIIFDIRNYPNATVWRLIPLFYGKPETWALFTLPDLTFPGWYSWVDNQFDGGDFTNINPYPGRVIILVNETTQSQAEYTAMGLQQHTDSFTIGSQTAGADGNVTAITLPGSLITYWSTLGVYYPDTMTAQRVGVRIDSIVTPTIQGIRQGRDEVLEAAFDCLTQTEIIKNSKSRFSIYPNPADEYFQVFTPSIVGHALQLEVSDALGHRVFQQSVSAAQSEWIPIDVSTWPSGFYLVTLSEQSKYIGTEKILIQH